MDGTVFVATESHGNPPVGIRVLFELQLIDKAIQVAGLGGDSRLLFIACSRWEWWVVHERAR
jgi:hypothetical protein